MPKSKKTSRIHKSVADYIKSHPIDSFQKIAADLGVAYSTISRIDKIYGLSRNQDLTKHLHTEKLIGLERLTVKEARKGDEGTIAFVTGDDWMTLQGITGFSPLRGPRSLSKVEFAESRALLKKIKPKECEQFGIVRLLTSPEEETAEDRLKHEEYLKEKEAEDLKIIADSKFIFPGAVKPNAQS